MSSLIFKKYIENDNDKITSKLKRVFYIYNKFLKLKKFKYFFQYFQKTIKKDSFEIKKKIFERLLNDIRIQEEKNFEKKVRYQNTENDISSICTFTPKINQNYFLKNNNSFFDYEEKENTKNNFDINYPISTRSYKKCNTYFIFNDTLKNFSVDKKEESKDKYEIHSYKNSKINKLYNNKIRNNIFYNSRNNMLMKNLLNFNNLVTNTNNNILSKKAITNRKYNDNYFSDYYKENKVNNFTFHEEEKGNNYNNNYNNKNHKNFYEFRQKYPITNRKNKNILNKINKIYKSTEKINKIYLSNYSNKNYTKSKRQSSEKKRLNTQNTNNETKGCSVTSISAKDILNIKTDININKSKINNKNVNSNYNSKRKNENRLSHISLQTLSDSKMLEMAGNYADKKDDILNDIKIKKIFVLSKDNK